MARRDLEEHDDEDVSMEVAKLLAKTEYCIMIRNTDIQAGRS